MIPKLLSPHSERAYAVLRIVAGALFASYGAFKVMGIPGGQTMPVGSLAWVAGLIELVTGIALVLGLFTSWAAFFACGMMAIAYIHFHWKYRFDEYFFPVKNEGGPAMLFCFVFLYIACKGAGRWSLDAKMRRPEAS